MTNAEMFAAFQAFMAAQNAQTDVVADVAADVVKTGTTTTTTVKATKPLDLVIVKTLTGTVQQIAGSGKSLLLVGGTLWIKSVDRKHDTLSFLAKGTEVSLGINAGECIVTVNGTPVVSKDAPVVAAPGAAPVAAPVAAPKLTPEQEEIAALKAKLAALEAPKDAPAVAAPLHPTVKTGTCPFCGMVPAKPTSAPHGNEKGTWIRCLLHQFGNETGVSIVKGEAGNGAKFAAFGAWIDASDHVFWSTNAQAWEIQSGASAPDPTTVELHTSFLPAPVVVTDPALPAFLEKNVAPKGRRPMHPCAGAAGKLRTTGPDGKCKACRDIETAPESPVATQETPETAGSVSVDVAAAEGIVPTPRTAPTEGTFKCYVDKFKTGAQSNPAQPIVRLFNGAELMNDVGVGFTVRCASAEILSKLAKYPTATWFTVTFKNGLVVKVTRVLNEKTGFKAPVQDTAGIKASGKNDAPIPATPRKDDTPAERRAAMRKTAGKGKATGLVSVTSEHCPKCSRRFSMVGRNATSIVCKACEAA